MIVGAWSDFEGLTIPAGTTLVRTTDTLAAGSSVGTASALYKLDDCQDEFTPQMLVYLAQSEGLGTPTTDAENAMRDLQKLWRRKNDGLDQWFTLAEEEPWTGQFGCPGDGAQSVTKTPPSGPYVVTTTGTDVFVQLQGFIDYCVYFAKCKGRIGRGTHRVSQGLQHGYGDRFLGGVFEGAGQAYAGSSSFVGSTIICDVDDNPYLNIAGGRDTVWRGISFRGKYTQWMADNALGYPISAPVLDDLAPNSWLASYLRNTQDGRCNPCALVATDTYVGAKPSAAVWAASTAYTARDVVVANGNAYHCVFSGTSAAGPATGPSGTGDLIVDGGCTWRYLGADNPSDRTQYTAYAEPYRPAWLVNPNTTAWRPGPTPAPQSGSFATFDQVTFVGQCTGFVSKPCLSSAQGDFIAFHRCNFFNDRFCASAGNDQLRNPSFLDCNFGIYDCALTDNTHGMRVGAFKGSVVHNCGFGSGTDIHRFVGTYAQPIIFSGCYCEAQRRVGSSGGGGRAISGVRYDGCEFSFSGINEARGRVARLLYNGLEVGDPLMNETSTNLTTVTTTFNNCRINVDSVFDCDIEGVTFNNTIIFARDRSADSATNPYPAYISLFHNTTAGGLILRGLEYRMQDQFLVFDLLNIDTGRIDRLQANTGRGYPFGSRQYCIPAMVKSVRARSGLNYEELPVPHYDALLLSKNTGGHVVSFPNAADPTELHFLFPGANKPNSADYQGFGPGSVVLDSPTGTVWAVQSFDDATDMLVAVAQNNYRTVGGVRQFIYPVSTTAGTMMFKAGRIYTPGTPMFGTLSTASTTVSAVGTITGSGTTLTTDIAVGDYIHTPQQTEALTANTTAITAVTNGSPGSFVLNANPTRSVTGQRLAFFRRACPPNP